MMKYYPAPAKINHSLRIVKQEENGYHYLQTIFQLTNLYDEIGFQITNKQEISFSYSHKDFSLEDDLIYRAILALQHECNLKFGLNINLKKRTPMGAGLGGGSSNAATTLVVLNDSLKLNLSQETLLSIGNRLGADVPIFIYGQSAWAEGINNEFTPLELPEKEYLLITPPIHISTKTIFTSPFLSRNNLPFTKKELCSEYRINDCENAIFHHYPLMKQYIDELKSLNCDPFITGTGSSIYLSKPDNLLFEEIEQLAKKNQWRLQPFTALKHSILYERLKKPLN